MMKKICLIALMLFVAPATKAQIVSLSADEITKLKQLLAADQSAQKLYAAYKKTADAALNESPSPIDTLHSEGRLKGDPQKTATGEALRDMRKMYALALVYRVGGDKKYLNKAEAYLSAWAVKNIPNGDPIDDTNLDPAVEAYDLIKTALDAKSNQTITAWLLQIAEMEIRKMKPGKETSYNNWNSHRLKEIGEIGFAIGDKKLQLDAITGIKLQIAKNLMPDGSSIDFKLRDALHYHAYDLEPLIKLSIILKRATGVDYYNYVSDAQSSINKSVHWFLPYIKGTQTHGEFVNSTVSFDKKRANNGESGYKAGVLFEPKNGMGVLLLAEYFEPDAINIIQKLAGSTTNYTDWQLVLNQVRL